ncbi:hypothetical protein BIY23_04510 [Wolbachia pipientis]|uniref:DUF3857 domain-containing protein n=1 Tax=Wolbachia pipientis TaxID=955 RepID=A0A1E7QK62_WOLPI|nr:DUF3857 domain-containing protein [Wolbachia pipientis]OEY86861.1 hypothetical protein BIY23_04510 [Wolbachia pipientis]
MQTYLKIFLYLLSFFVIHVVEARWCNYEDAGYESEFINEDVVINADGSTKSIIESQNKILKESGRSTFTHYNLTYNSNISQITILAAKTIYNGKEYKVKKDMIEDKPIASSGYGFDQLNQITISFPKVELGSQVYLKYKSIKKKQPIKDFFGKVFGFSSLGCIKQFNGNIKSKLPLHIKLNDPRNSLKIVNEKKDDVHNINITLSKPICECIINEPQFLVDSKYSTWIILSSLNNWEDFAKKLFPGYYNVINQELPEIFMDIANAASSRGSDTEQINFITSSLSEKIQYMGDWRTIEGGYFPRDLKKIADSQVGDCKDFSAATAAILQKLGYKVQPLWVTRGTTAAFLHVYPLPTFTDFNHVMLKVTSKKEKVYWIDPTNMVSMAQGIFPDIADRDALILDDKEAGLTKVPKIDYQNSKVIHDRELIIKDDLVEQRGVITMCGESAQQFTGYGLDVSNDQLKEMAFHEISGTYLVEDEKKFLELPDLTSRVVKDLTIKYVFQKKNMTYKTNLGNAFTLRANAFTLRAHDWLHRVINTASDQVSDIFIDIPQTIEIRTTIKDINVKDCSRLNFKANSPWLHVNRSCNHQNGSTQFIDTILILKNFITNEELKSVEYKNLKNKLESDFANVSVIIN